MFTMPATEPAGDADSATVTESFDVIPSDAACRVLAPADATIAPASGAARTVTLDVTVTCHNRTQSDEASAAFTATAVGGCNSELGAFSDAGTAVSGTLSAGDGCTSMRRRSNSDGIYHAKRHILRLAHPGWVTVTLEADRAYPAGPDTYVMILAGAADDGSGRRLEHNDDHRSDYRTHWRNSRIADRYLPAGVYTVEATTYYRHDPGRPAHTTGDYTLTVAVDHTPRADGQPAELEATVGDSLVRTWGYSPGAADVAITSTVPDGITATVARYPAGTSRETGTATLAATVVRAGSYDIDVTYTNGTATAIRTTAITATCPTDHTEIPAGGCVPDTATLSARCTLTVLHGGLVWGRREHDGQYRRYGSDADAGCDSLTHSAKAVYYSFALPERLPVEFELRDAISMATLRAGGAPSLTVWRVTSAHPVTGRAVQHIATASTDASGPAIARSLDAGSYLVEVAPSRAVSRSFEDSWYKLRTDMPTGARTHADVQNVGNTGRGGAGMTLGQFLDARGSLIYGGHPDADPARAADPFYPESVVYPWLAFTTDRCSIPPAWILHLAENAIDEAAIRLGPLGWLAAHFLLPDADEIQDRPQFGGVTVSFVYGCMRHDFNWRNLHRVKHHLEYDTAAGTWNNTVRGDADTRLGTDLEALCKANQSDAPETSSYHTWTLPDDGAIRRCKQAADTIVAALGKVPFGRIGSTYDHD